MTLQKIEQKSSWETVPLRDSDVQCLRSVAKAAATGRSLGNLVLFFGGTGTAKTLAAGALAQEAGLALYRVDVGRVMSKYIGETEKNLAALFREAAVSRSVLLFDEADALFGDRSDTRDGTDRYANQLTDYLLQRIEAHAGIVILASNQRTRLAEALARRSRCVVLLSA